MVITLVFILATFSFTALVSTLGLASLAWIAKILSTSALCAALLVPNAAEDVMLQNLLNKTAPQNQKLQLYKSNTTPAETDTEATYTVADFTGYADAALTGSSWTITPGAPTSAAYAQQTFTSSAGSQNQNVYGYLVIQTTSGKILWSERFSDGPYNIVNSGDAIKVTPQLTLE
jgi:hypothetical protein